jgi:hypothetical protein
MRQWLTAFFASCRSEIMSDSVVKQLYDTVYVLFPLWTAICSKDDNGSYCITKLPSSNGLKNATSTGGLSKLLASLAQNATVGTGTTLVPNITTLQSTNLPFLFIQPESGSQAALASNSYCTACTRNILTAYVNFESAIPYGPGMAQSIILAGQQSLYNAVTNTCGATFLSGVVQAAGGLAGGTLSSGAMQNMATLSQGFIMGILAVLASIF